MSRHLSIAGGDANRPLVLLGMFLLSPDRGGGRKNRNLKYILQGELTKNHKNHIPMFNGDTLQVHL